MSNSRKDLVLKIAELEAENAQYKAWVEALGRNGNFDLWFKDKSSTYRFCNDQFAGVMGSERQNLEGKKPVELFDAERAKRIKAMDAKVMEEGLVHRVIPCGTDQRAEMHEEFRFPVIDDDGDVIGLGCCAFEVTEKSVAEETLIKAEKLARMGSWRWGARDNILVSCSERLAELLQYPLTELFALFPQRIEKLVHPEDRHLLKPVTDRIKGRVTAPYAIEYRMIRADGQTIFVREAAEPFADSEKRTSEYIGIIQDISRQKVAELQLQISKGYLEKRVESRIKDLKYLATHDPLTGLLNRHAFIEKILASTEKFQPSGKVLILCLDIRGFSSVNDRYGYKAGDKVMKEAARRISLSTNGYAYASRMNGDEFVLALPTLNNVEKTVRAMFKHIEQNVRKDINVDGNVVSLDLTGGYSVGACEERALIDAIRNAGIALTKAKALPHVSLAFHIPGLNSQDRFASSA